ncbi:hypothetical protein [Leptospira licerasiae]
MSKTLQRGKPEKDSGKTNFTSLLVGFKRRIKPISESHSGAVFL